MAVPRDTVQILGILNIGWFNADVFRHRASYESLLEQRRQSSFTASISDCTVTVITNVCA